MRARVPSAPVAISFPFSPFKAPLESFASRSINFGDTQ